MVGETALSGKYTAYPEYKDSGAEWLGAVPSDWVLMQAKHKFVLQRGHDLSSDQMIEGDYLVYGSNGPIGKHNEFTTPGPSITVGRSGSVGEVNYVEQDFWAHNTSLYLKDFKSTPPRFIYYLLKAINPKRLSAGSAVGTLDRNNIHNQIVAAPSDDESEKIANFLDHETAKIDTLIGKQQQLIKLLKEKRQAVISHAVTKGLNPNAPMRDSGVEWLGEVPEHWVVAQLKFNTLEMQTGPFGSQLHAEDYVIDGIPLINPAHMIAGKIVPDSKVTVDEETQERLSRHKLSEGEIIFARRGELGRCAIVTKGQEGWLCGTGSLKAKLNNRLIPEYAYLLITSDGVVSELSLESKGSTMDNLNTETLGRVRMPIPPESEQNDILKYVNDVSGKYKSLISNAESAIELMQERRTALISATVTGKIDVRHFNLEEGQPSEPSKTTINKTKEVAA